MIRLPFVASALALALAACSQNADTPAPEGNDASPSAAASPSGTPTATATDPQAAADPYDGPIPLPVKVGGNADLDACGTAARVVIFVGSDADYASVRDAPSDQVKERDRLAAGRTVNICAEQSGWSAIVYPGEGQTAQACGLGTPIAQQRNYTGPCASGWVDSRYLEQVAG